MTICEQLQNLRLYYLASNLEHFLVQAAKSKWTHKDAISRFTELEIIDKTNRSTQQRMKSAKIGRTKLMNEFDWAWPKEIDRAVIEELMLTNFIKDHQNIIFAGSQGAGKTMIAKNIGLSAIANGKRVQIGRAHV